MSFAAELRKLIAKATPMPWEMSHRHVNASENDDELHGLGWDWSGDNQPEEPMRGVFSKAADAKLLCLLVNHADRIAELVEAAATLKPLLEFGWDEMDEPSDIAEGDAACARFFDAIDKLDEA